jgi:hypothetical protein
MVCPEKSRSSKRLSVWVWLSFMASSERYAGQMLGPPVNKTGSNNLDGRCFASLWSNACRGCQQSRSLAGNARSDARFPSEDIGLYTARAGYLLFKA